MSRRRKRPQPSTSVIEQERPQSLRRAPNIRPGATNFQPVVNDKIIQSMYQSMGPQADQSYMYSPGAPIRPIPGITPPTGPRQFAFEVGYNIAQLPRSTEQYSFPDLRALSSMYHGVQMCQQVWFDYTEQLELVIEPLPSLIGEDGDASQYQDDIDRYLEFFAYPDKEHDMHTWLQMMTKDQLEIDAVAIFPRCDKAGRLYSLDLIDAATIKPLVDDRGRRPLPPYPAYEQFVYGVPAAFFTSDELIYFKETSRTDSVYGRSRVEKIILNINIALRKLTKDLAHFTDGNLPPGFVTPSMDVQWSQEEIEAWELQLNNLMAGNDEVRARLKVLPRGFEYQSVLDPDIHIDLDTHILNLTAAAHGLTMAELAFIADVNRASSDGQENVIYRRAMGPLMKRYARLLTYILQKYFHEKRFRCTWKGYEEKEDVLAQSQAYAGLTNAGILGLTDAAKIMKLPQDPNAPYIGRVFFSKDGPIFLDDMASDKMRNAALQAKLAGFQMAANPPSPDEKQASSENENDPQNEDEEEDTALSRLTAQVQDILARLERRDKQSEEDDEDEQIEREITALLLEDEDEPLTTLERDWAEWNKEHPYQKHPRQKGKHQHEEEKKDTEPEASDEKQDTSKPKSAGAKARAAAHVAVGHHQAKARQALAHATRQTRTAKSPAQKAQAKASRAAARAQAKNARALASLTKNISAKSAVYEALANRKISKSWTAQDAANAKTLAADLTQLADLIGKHSGDAGSVIESMERAIQGLLNQAPKTMSSTRANALKKLADVVKAQVSRSQVPDWLDDLDDGEYDYAEEDTEQVETETRNQGTPENVAVQADAASISDEYRRWRSRAIDDAKANRAQRGFTTTIIPEVIHGWISRELALCSTADQVKDVFSRVREHEGDTSFFVTVVVSGDGQVRSNSNWKPKW